MHMKELMTVDSYIEPDPRIVDSGIEHAAAVCEFLAHAAYAIRSPVNIILGYSELIAQRLIALGDDSQRPYLEGIRRSGRQILETINRILDYSRIEQGTLPVVPERIDLAGLLEKLTQDYRVLAAAKKLALICEIEELSAGVVCDAYCLTGVLSNLIDNAIKFTHTGGAVIKLCRDSQERLCIEVRDSGVGFDPERMRRAFAGSYDGDAQRYEQSGLGLMLTHKYLDLIGASIAISSTPGKGSVFTVIFPPSMEVHWEPRRAAQTSAAPPQAAPTEAVAERARPGAAQPTVLVVEDQPDQALFMRALLEGKYKVEIASNAREAMALLEQPGEKAGLILMDLSLSGGEDGLTLTRRIRADARLRHIPIVVATAHAFEQDRERALSAGCNAYLVKPIDAKQLLATIGRLAGQPHQLAG
jgi:CheY-like chemotaxis protein/anti-sigma regulatory factor (Ser/Thr protein kinase)